MFLRNLTNHHPPAILSNAMRKEQLRLETICFANYVLSNVLYILNAKIPFIVN